MSDKKSILWPMSIRLIHWSLALSILLNQFILEDGDPPHRYVGYLAVLIVFLRFYRGVKDNTFANFKHFPMGISHQIKFLKNILKRDSSYEGHNPPASLIYFAIWSSVILLGISGWMLGLDAFWGDERVEEIHELLSDGLLVLTLIHLTGIIFDSLKFKRKTWMGMISGRRDHSVAKAMAKDASQ